MTSKSVSTKRSAGTWNFWRYYCYQPNVPLEREIFWHFLLLPTSRSSGTSCLFTPEGCLVGRYNIQMGDVPEERLVKLAMLSMMGHYSCEAAYLNSFQRSNWLVEKISLHSAFRRNAWCYSGSLKIYCSSHSISNRVKNFLYSSKKVSFLWCNSWFLMYFTTSWTWLLA